MWQIILKMFDLSKENRLRNKVSAYIKLEKSLKGLENNIIGLADEFNLRKLEKDQFLKINKSEDISKKVLSRFNNFEKSHIKNIGRVKRKKDSILKSMSNISTGVDNFEDLIKSKKVNDLYSVILIKYRLGNYNLDKCDQLLKAVKKDKVKYADNIVFNEKGQLLLLKRSELEESQPGFFTIPGGHVDSGEDFETAAKRELLEEAGIKSDITTKVGEYKDKNVYIEYFQSYVENVEPVLQEEEIWSYEWVNPKELDKYKLPFNMGDNLKKILFPFKKQIIRIKKSFNSGLISKIQMGDLLIKANNKFINVEKNYYISELEKSINSEIKKNKEVLLEGVKGEIIGEIFKGKTSIKKAIESLSKKDILSNEKIKLFIESKKKSDIVKSSSHNISLDFIPIKKIVDSSNPRENREIQKSIMVKLGLLQKLNNY